VKTTTANKGFSAMLVDEYILIVPSAYHLQSGLNEQSRATEHNINCINFTQQLFGLKLTQNISTAESPGLVRHFKRQPSSNSTKTLICSNTFS
jgi:hypothetical protein